MKKYLHFLFGILFALFVNNVSAQYCQPTTSYPQYMGIAGINLNTINYISHSNTGFRNNTNLSTELIPGNSYTITVYGSNYYNYGSPNWAQYARVWIDFNGNNSFESNEVVVSSLYFYNSGSATFTVPTNVAVSSTRLRVKSDYYYNYYGSTYLYPCNNSTYGETEDYTVTFGNPVVKTKNITVALNANGEASITPQSIDNGTYDNDGPVQLSINKSNFDCNNTGNNTVTLTAVDINGYSSSANATVTVVDNIIPTVLTKNAIIEIDASGTASLTSMDIDDGSFDNCVINEMILSQSDFNCTNLGDNIVTLTVVDVNGNTNSANATVTVVDNIIPTVSVPANITINSASSQCGATANYNATANDNCNVEITYSHESGSSFPVGITTVLVTAKDISGNTTTESFNIEVIDTELPNISCPFDITLNADAGTCGAVVNYEIPTATDNCGTGVVPTTLANHTFKGIYNGHSYFVSNAPATPEAAHAAALAAGGHLATISDLAENNYIASLSPEKMWIGFTDRDQEGTWKWISSEPVTYTNWSSGEPNNAGGNEDWAVINWAGTTWNDWYYTQPAYYVIEFDGGTLPTTLVSGLESGSEFPIGTTVVTYQVTDPSGNTVECSFNVTVNDNQPPVIETQNIDAILTANGTATITADQVVTSVTDNCGEVTYSINKNTFDANDAINSPVTIFVTATDKNGNTSTAPVEVSVIDPVPVANCQDISVNLDANGLATITAQQIDNGSTSIVGIASMSLDQSAFDCSHVGTNTVTLTVTSILGSSASCTATVTVNDTSAPTVITQNITIQLDENGSASINIDQINNGSIDNCGIVSLSLSNNTFNAQNLGENTVILTATDEAGNSASTSAKVTLVDNIAPEIVLKDITVKLDVNGTATIAFDDIDNGTSDNSGVFSAELDLSSFDCSNVGENTITVTAKDESGGPDGTFTHHLVSNIYGGQRTKLLAADFDNDGDIDLLTPNTVYLNNGSGLSYSPRNLTVYQHAHGGAIADFNNDGYADVYVEGRVFVGNGNGSFTYKQQLNSYSVFGKSVAADFNGDGIIDIFDPTYYTQVNPLYFGNGDGTFTHVQDYQFGAYQISATTGDYDGDGDIDIVTVGYYDQMLMINDGNGSFTYSSIYSNPGYDTFAFSDDMDNDGDLDLIIPNVTEGVRIGWNDGNGNFTHQVLGGSSCRSLVITDVNGDTQKDIITMRSGAEIWINNGNATFSLTSSDLFTEQAGFQDILSADLNGDGYEDIAATKNGSTSIYLSNSTNGNSSTETAIVTIEDNIAPIALAQDVVVQLDDQGNGSTTAELVNNGSNDACGIASLILSQTGFDCSHVGQNTVTLTVTDVNGNISTVDAVVTVEDNVAPIALTQDVVVQLDDQGNGSTTAELVNNGSNDACGITSLVLSQTEFDCSHVGQNTITLTVTDVNGNVSTADAIVTVEDNVAPIALAQNVVVQLDDQGNGSTTAELVNNGSNDACGIASLILSQTGFDCSHVGQNTVTLTVTDVNGNVSTADAIVTVEDNVAPIAFCQSITLQLDENGEASIVPTDIDNGSNDACGIVLYEASQMDFNCSHIGDNTVTLTVTDVDNNVSTCNAIVTIENDLPVINSLTVSEVVDITNVVTAEANYTDVNLAEVVWEWGNGDVTSGTIDANSGMVYGEYSYAETGLYDVTVTVTDVCGETTTETFSYIVIYDPCAGHVTGGGYFQEGKKKNNFGFNAKYDQEYGYPKGSFNFHDKVEGIHVKADTALWLMVNNDQAIFHGPAKVDDVEGYFYLVSMIDGDVVQKNDDDYLRIIVWDEFENIIFDNQSGDADRVLAVNLIDSGSLKIHKGCDDDSDDEVTTDNSDDSSSDTTPDTDPVIEDDSSNNGKSKGKGKGKLTFGEIDVKLFPNPVAQKINLTFNNLEEQQLIYNIVDIKGRTVVNAQKLDVYGTSSTIDVSNLNLNKGNYMLIIYNEDKSVNQGKTFLKK